MSRLENVKGISLDIPLELYVELKNHAKKNDLTISQIIRTLIRNYLGEQK